MRYVYLCLLLIFAVPTLAQTSVQGTLTHDDLEREYTVYLPRDYDGSEPAPLVLFLHGANMTRYQMMRAVSLVPTGSESGYIMVYPQGIEREWNVAQHPIMADDAGFLTALLADLQATYTIDATRIFLGGYSNGGMMALGLGCQLSDELAGLIILGANYAYAQVEACVDTTPLPMFMLLSTTDEAFPWDGAYPYVISAETFFGFVMLNFNCSDEDIESEFVAQDESQYEVNRLRITDCDGRGALDFYAVIDAPHYPLPNRIRVALDNGETGNLVDLIWEFITTHQLQE